MKLKLYAHPFSSYCQKALIALYENSTPFEFRLLAHDDPQIMAEFADLWPIRRFPVLSRRRAHGDGGEHHHRISRPVLSGAGGARAQPSARAALDVPAWTASSTTIFRRRNRRSCSDSLRPDAERDVRGDDRKRARWSIRPAVAQTTTIAAREWAAGDTFSLADCGGGARRFYADWSHAIIDPASPRCSPIGERAARPAYAPRSPRSAALPPAVPARRAGSGTERRRGGTASGAEPDQRSRAPTPCDNVF